MMIRSWFTRAAIASALLVSPSLALAMTAEGAFAFIILNVEDGDKFAAPNDGGLASVTVTAKTPLTFEIAFASGDKPIYEITQTKPCVFDVAAKLGEGGNANIIFDMNKFVGLPVFSTEDNLIFSNECAIQVAQNGRCLGAKFKPGMLANGDFDRERMKRAIEFFKKEFCAGSPF
ncbi:hypothetical protein IHQ71_18640 [Rhizobium sp. TH2]|uniref:hypothetical protein n=1 Tax=Rhizobium sp. TH2 TaxID=2775403 RepID=UPI002158645A|nr:hypothetical protein [Rhizobium sp. TH2]UVC07226.1 hypothetical protein IHQ71_18640 [Rhizobium sp. TH2]